MRRIILSRTLRTQNEVTNGHHRDQNHKLTIDISNSIRLSIISQRISVTNKGIIRSRISRLN